MNDVQLPFSNLGVGTVTMGNTRDVSLELSKSLLDYGNIDLKITGRIIEVATGTLVNIPFSYIYHEEIQAGTNHLIFQKSGYDGVLLNISGDLTKITMLGKATDGKYNYVIDSVLALSNASNGGLYYADGKGNAIPVIGGHVSKDVPVVGANNFVFSPQTIFTEDNKAIDTTKNGYFKVISTPIPLIIDVNKIKHGIKINYSNATLSFQSLTGRFFKGDISSLRVTPPTPVLIDKREFTKGLVVTGKTNIHVYTSISGTAISFMSDSDMVDLGASTCISNASGAVQFLVIESITTY